jgi:MFS family permease
MTVLGAPARVALAPIVVSVVIVLPITLLGALFVKIGPEFGLDQAALGLLAAVFLGVSILMAPAAGVLGEHHGPARAMVGSAVLAAIACGGIAAFAHSGLGLVPWLCIAGLANAFGQTATAIFIVQTIPLATQGLAFGVKQATAPLGTLLAGIAVPAVALTIGWRWAFAITVVLAIGAAVAVPPLGRPVHHGRRTKILGTLRARRSVLVLVVAIMLGVGAASALGVFFVDATVASGLSAAAAGWLQALGSSLAVVARLIAGRVSDTVPTGHLRLVVVMLATGAFGYLLLGLDGPLSTVAGTLLAFAMGWGWVGVFFFAVVRLNSDAPGAATGLVQTGDFIGSLVGPVLFGTLASGDSYRIAWFAAAVLAVLGATVTAVADRAARHRVAVGRPEIA